MVPIVVTGKPLVDTLAIAAGPPIMESVPVENQKRQKEKQIQRERETDWI